MDHRHGRREAARLSVVLHNRHTPPIQAQIVSLSAGGAFIRLPSMARPLGDVVRLRFSLPLESSEPREWSALIVRGDADGVGVMFGRRHDRAFAQFIASQEGLDEALPDSQPARGHGQPASRCKTSGAAAPVSVRHTE